MSEVSTWSTTSDNNNSTPPNGWPEGMQYSQVNNAAREMMGAIARWRGNFTATYSLPFLLGTATPPPASFGIVPCALNATTSGGIAAAQQNYSVDNTLYGTVAAVNYGLGTYFQIAAIGRGLDLTGTTVTVPTPAAGNNTTQAATTAFVVTHSTSGTYTPTLAAVLNAGALTAHKCQYQRINNIVTVSGTADLTPTAGGATIVSLTLPVASNFATQQDANGTATATNAAFISVAAGVYADAATDTARILFIAPTAGSATTVAFSFQYEVL